VATPSSLRRIARLAQKLEQDLKAGGMAYPWRSLFRTNAILTRIVAHLADHLASEAEGTPSKAPTPRMRRTRVTVEAERSE
jgi:hypothetical protein